MITKSGKVIQFVDSFEPLPQLENKNYLVKQNPQTGEFFLEEQDSFTLPNKIYGDPSALARRYLNTYNNGSNNKGVLLTGLKGTGKSLLAKKVCIDSNLPVIIITSSFCGTDFNSFIANIKQECVIFIDEFEKTYSFDDTNTQESLLSLFDGTFEGKKLFLLTANALDVHDAFINRPGRIHYLKEYGSLERSIIEEIIEDKLDNKDYRQDILDICSILGEVSIDSIMTLVKESNLYKESPKESIKYLNINPSEVQFEVSWIPKGHCKKESVTKSKHPLTNPVFRTSLDYITKNSSGDNEWFSSEIFRTNIDAIPPTIEEDGSLTMIDDNGIEFNVVSKKKYSFAF